MDDYPISAVVKTLRHTRRPVTRHWIQQCKKEVKLFKPAKTGKGRHGDRYTAETICQLALFYDLCKAGFRREESSILTFNEITSEMFSRVLHHHNVLADERTAEMDAVFMRNRRGEIKQYYIESEQQYRQLYPKIRRARLTFIANVSVIGWEVMAVLEELA